METKPHELVDAFWKNWSHSLSLFSSAGKQMEQLTLETLKHQQEALHKLTESTKEIEKEIEKEIQQFSAQANAQYNEYVKQLSGNSFNEQMDGWQEKWNELSNHMQQLTVSPTKTSLSLLSQTSEQFEEAVKQLISQQQQQREEVQKQMESFLEEFKSMQLDLVKKFEENSKNLFTSMK
ncbi:polyhydroxyalkanoic acid inclusion protein PhaP [Bacillus sp. S10(2024)]|uniref:polyhydroxyalkanoic acid inclusion protein PhaP n=1 Tax=Bacillus sp. S10(2024) TaxID=3162886 RepID=UPI003D1A1738